MRSEAEAGARPPQDTYSISSQEYIVSYSAAPMVPAFDTGSQWVVFCPFCRCLHYHGRLPGHRSPHCMTKEISPGYILIPTNRPLPADATQFGRRGRRRIDRLLDPFRPKQTHPQPIPEWGRPIEDRDTALAMLAAWEYETCQKRGDAFWSAMEEWEQALPRAVRR